MNFIIFNPDEMRADHLGCYGHPISQTPNIDRLASGGTRFAEAHCQNTVCTPSRCSVMTGWYPHVRGHRSLQHLLQPDEPNLLSYLKQAGYYVWWGGGHNDLLAEESFEDSVSEYHDSNGHYHGQNPYDISDPRYYSYLYSPVEGDVEDHGDQLMVKKATDFIRSKPDDPYVVYLPLIYPHCPYCAPQPWHDMYAPEDIPELRPVDEQNRPSHHRLIRSYRRLDQIEESHFQKVNAVYLGMISYVDFLLGQILDALEQSDQADNTCILFFSDHGDYAGDYGLVEKWSNGLEDVLTHVPLIIRTPGGKPGHIVQEPVELFDVMATVLDLAQVDPTHVHFSRSQVPQLNGAAGDSDRAIFAEGGYDLHEPHCSAGYAGYVGERSDPRSIYTPKHLQLQQHPQSASRSVMIRQNHQKLIYRTNGENELYDLQADPKELINRVSDPDCQSVVSHLRGQLLDWYLRTSDVTPLGADPRGLPKKDYVEAHVPTSAKTISNNPSVSEKDFVCSIR